MTARNRTKWPSLGAVAFAAWPLAMVAAPDDAGPIDPAPGEPISAPQAAVAHLEPNATIANNKTSGSVYFSPTSAGLELSGRLMQLSDGEHGMHIHVRGSCTDPGDHFAADETAHGAPGEGEHHLGDLGNVQPDPASEAWISMNVEGLSLQGDRSVIGKALVVAEDPDDLKTQPSGNSGGVLACGIIQADGADEDAEVQPEAQARR